MDESIYRAYLWAYAHTAAGSINTERLSVGVDGGETTRMYAIVAGIVDGKEASSIASRLQVEEAVKMALSAPSGSVSEGEVERVENLIAGARMERSRIVDLLHATDPVIASATARAVAQDDDPSAIVSQVIAALIDRICL